MANDAPQRDTAEAMQCPDCGTRLFRVRWDAETSMLNADQFDAVRAGDYYCDKCPSNGRGNTRYRYFWECELCCAPYAGRLRADSVHSEQWEDIAASLLVLKQTVRLMLAKIHKVSEERVLAATLGGVATLTWGDELAAVEVLLAKDDTPPDLISLAQVEQALQGWLLPSQIQRILAALRAAPERGKEAQAT